MIALIVVCCLTLGLVVGLLIGLGVRVQEVHPDVFPVDLYAATLLRRAFLRTFKRYLSVEEAQLVMATANEVHREVQRKRQAEAA